MSRPTKFNEKIVDLLDEYIEMAQDVWKEYIRSESMRSSDDGESSTKSVEWKLEGELPTIEGFSEYTYQKKMGVALSTLHYWQKSFNEAEKDDENIELKLRFLDSLERLLNLQKKRLMNGGVTGRYSAVMSKMLLSVNHGMTEKQEVEHSGSLSLGGVLGEIGDGSESLKE